MTGPSSNRLLAASAASMVRMGSVSLTSIFASLAARRAAWWPRCAARRWRAVDRGADSAAAPSHAAGRVASSAPKQTRARGAAAAAKTSTVYFSFSSRLVSSCRRRTRARRAPRVAAFAPRRTIRTGSQSAQRRHAAAKRTTLTSWRCCVFGTS